MTVNSSHKGMIALIALVFGPILMASACTPSPKILNWQTFLGSTGASRTREAWATAAIIPSVDRLSLDVSVTIPYLSRSTINGNSRGVTFHVDFDTFPGYGRSISMPNNCGNREASSFAGKSFPNWWTYASAPWMPGQIGNASTNMQYGPSNKWTMSVTMPANMNNNSAACECPNVTLSRSFSLDELQGCRKFDGGSAFSLIRGNGFSNLTGALHVEVVSPRFSDRDFAYNVVTLQRIPIEISFRAPANFYTQANVRNYGIEPTGARYLGANTDIVELTFITWCPRPVRLEIPSAVLFTPVLNTRPYVNGIHSITETSPYITSGGYADCMVTTGFRCFQRTVVLVNVSNACPIGATIDLSGLYGLQMDVHCNSSELSPVDLAACTNYVAANPAGALTQPIGWNIACDRVDYSILLTGSLKFYEDATFVNPYTSPPTFIVEESTAWVELRMTVPSSLSVLRIEVISAYICTLKPGFDMTQMNGATGDGGCIQNPNVDNGPNDPFYILLLNGEVNGALNFAVAKINAPGLPNVARFSFTVPTMLRDEFYLHVQAQVTIGNATQSTRRLVEMDFVDGKHEPRRLQSSGGRTAFKNSQTRISTKGPLFQETDDSTSPGVDTMTIAVIALSSVIVCALICGAGWYGARKMRQSELEKETLDVQSVKSLEIDMRAAVVAGVQKLDSTQTPLTPSQEKEIGGDIIFGVGQRESVTRVV